MHMQEEVLHTNKQTDTGSSLRVVTCSACVGLSVTVGIIDTDQHLDTVYSRH